ncbi:cation:proton antiporter [Devosia sp.]|uniref:cation:proton antiporter n=1 Tax=Devosia sp. TaxID=1871048 RepID=UPI002F226404
MSGGEVLQHATTLSLGILLVALLLTVARLIRGPTLADRILALDLLTVLAIGFIAAIAIRTGFSLYLDIAISIGLLGFLSTVALARYLLRQAEKSGANSGEAPR